MWLRGLRASSLDETLAALYVGAVVVALHAGMQAVWLSSAAFIAAAAAYGWIKSYQRLRHVNDIPTARIASAPQGFVELLGTAQTHEDRYLHSKLGNVRCVWYRYLVEERTRNDKYTPIDRGSSEDTFLLRDATGDCVIDPDGATVVAVHRRQWTNSPYRKTEWWIAPGDLLYALGWFRTLHGGDHEASTSEEVSELLAQWKKDRPELLRRFDRDGNGEIDLKEWEAARAAARSEVARSQMMRAARPGLHLMQMPRDGRPYLLSGKPPGALSRHLMFWTYGHFAAMALAVAALSGLSLM